MRVYIEHQLAKLNPSLRYNQSIMLFDGNGNKTNQLGISLEQYNKIVAILKGEI